MATYVFDEVDNVWHRLVKGTQADDNLNGFTDPANLPPLDARSLDSHLPQDELIYGYAGNDHIFGRDGWDIIHGGNGKDIENGGSGYDQLFGEGGNDFLTDPDHAMMYGQGGNDVMRLTVLAPSASTGYYSHGGYMTGGMGADQFRATLLGVADIDDAYPIGLGTARIWDFHAGQGDKILLQATLAGGAKLSAQQTFNLLDTNDDQKLNEHDGSTAMGRVTYDGSSTDSDTNITTLGSLHLQLGGTELEVMHTAQLTVHDFILG